VTEPSYPGAVPPERSRAFEPGGVRLNLLEWGDPQAAPLVLTHGMWDHARSFAVLAPLLAARFRVVAIDARGHEPAPTAPSAGPS
jgi:pimeloyl-ACP methyl ester carboxylesterase